MGTKTVQDKEREREELSFFVRERRSQGEKEKVILRLSNNQKILGLWISKLVGVLKL